MNTKLDRMMTCFDCLLPINFVRSREKLKTYLHSHNAENSTENEQKTVEDDDLP